MLREKDYRTLFILGAPYFYVSEIPRSPSSVAGAVPGSMLHMPCCLPGETQN